MVAFTAGGTTDMLARSVSQHLGQRFKQSFVVENRPGGGGNIGTEYVVRAPADGYTLLVDSVGPISINQTLYKKLNYDPLTDLVPVVQIADVPNVLVVHPVGAGQDLRGVRRLHQGQPGQAELWLDGRGHLVAPVRASCCRKRIGAPRPRTCPTRAPMP